MAARILRAISSQKKGLGFLSAACPRSTGRLVHTRATYSQESLDKEFMAIHLRMSRQDYQNELMQQRFTNFQQAVRNDLNKSHSEMFQKNVAFYMVVVGLLFTAYPYFQPKIGETIPGPCVNENDSRTDQNDSKQNQAPIQLAESPNPAAVTKMTKMTVEATSSTEDTK